MCLCGGKGSCRVVRHLQETFLTVRCQLGWNLDGLRRNSSPSSRANYFDVCKRLWTRMWSENTIWGANVGSSSPGGEKPSLELGRGLQKLSSISDPALSQLLEAATTRRLQFHSNWRYPNLLVLWSLLLICGGSQSEHSPPFPSQLHFLDVRALLYYLISSLFYV
jgi:hypothetical protein